MTPTEKNMLPCFWLVWSIKNLKSWCNTKRRMARSRDMTPTLREKHATLLLTCVKYKKSKTSVSYQKKDPSFGMTQTQAFSLTWCSLLAWRIVAFWECLDGVYRVCLTRRRSCISCDCPPGRIPEKLNYTCQKKKEKKNRQKKKKERRRRRKKKKLLAFSFANF